MKLLSYTSFAAAATVAMSYDLTDSQDFTPVYTEVEVPEELKSNPIFMFNEMAMEYVQMFNEWIDLLMQAISSNEFLKQIVDAWNNYEVTTRHDSNRWVKEYIQPMPERSSVHRYAQRNVHHSIKAMRRQMGRPDAMPFSKLHALGQQGH